ncbi:unnamed protein product [marine sediment metagenome]|uniref:Uncharacterized protein n=1 Tax=marine sediment metagenome TaxID=412755 RepID=X1AYS1_9ZZZZ
MKCWECRKKVESAFRVRYCEYDKNIGYKGKYRKVCKDCYSRLKFTLNSFVEVEKIGSRQLKKKIGR